MNAKQQLSFTKRFSSSILLWVRSDQPRQTGMDYWRDPHSGIIAATPGFNEYRQIHLAESNPGLWPAVTGVETSIPVDRRVDGVAEVTFRSALSPLLGRKQTRLAYKDEINVFKRTLLYLGLPGSARWYGVGRPDEKVASRVLIYFRRREGVSARAFRALVNTELAPALAASGAVKELRTQTFLPWSEGLWDTPNVAHDNPREQQYHASVAVGFANPAARESFFASAAVSRLSRALSPAVSAIHAYDVTAALTYVKNGTILPHYTD